MTAFAEAVNALFADANLGVAAIYTPAGGAGVELTAILRKPDEVVEQPVTGVRVETWQADVRVAELPAAAAKGDTLAVGGETFSVRSIRRDSMRLIAILDLDKTS